MFKINDYVVYKRDVCQIIGIKDEKYYTLRLIDDNTLKLSVPITNDFGYLRSIISKEEAINLINDIVNVEVINNNNRLIENTYKELIRSNKLLDLVKIIKTTNLRNDNRLKNNKKISDKDNFYFDKAEKYLYNELSISLNMNYEEVKKYVFDTVSSIKK